MRSGCFKREYWRRGSFTVEAAVLVPLAIFLVAALVSLCFFLHDRTWFTGAACEAAIAGNATRDQSEAESRAAARAADRILPGEAPEVTVEVARSSTRVAFAGRRDWGLSWQFGSWSAEVEVRRVHPAADLQNVWALKRLGKEIWDD